MKLGDGKGSRTLNDLDNIKELKKQKSKFKRNIKALKKKVTNENDEVDDNDEPEDAGDIRKDILAFFDTTLKDQGKKEWCLDEASGSTMSSWTP